LRLVYIYIHFLVCSYIYILQFLKQLTRRCWNYTGSNYFRCYGYNTSTLNKIETMWLLHLCTLH